MKKSFLILPIIPFLFFLNLHAQHEDYPLDVPNECTSITMGKKATDDGSVRTSHTDDSHRTRSNIFVTPAKNHREGASITMYKRLWDNTSPMVSYRNDSIGTIPQIAHTFSYLNTAYPCMNEKQLAIGESTFGGRGSLQSDVGLIDCQRLCTLMLERCSTARQAITVAGELLKTYGWIDAGECLTVADKQEVWHFGNLRIRQRKQRSGMGCTTLPDDHIPLMPMQVPSTEIDTDKQRLFYVFRQCIFIGARQRMVGRERAFPFLLCLCS